MAEFADSLPGEIWKPVAGYEGRFAVSSHGLVKRIGPRRIAKSPASRPQAPGQERIWPGVKVNGYYKVLLGGRAGRYEYVHRLVCAAFHGPPPEGKNQVAHYDGDKLNNRADNLRWVDWKGNREDGRRLGEFGLGEAHGCNKYPEQMIRDIRNEYAARNGERGTINQIANRLGIARGYVGEVIKRKVWKHI